MEQQEANYYKIPPLPTLVNEGLTRPIWIGSELLLARRVANGSEVLIQGCWLDWPKIKRLLMQEIADLLPEADLLPVSTQNNVPPGRMLATLPVQLVVPVPIAVAAPLSPIRISLWIAWGCLLLAAVAVACLLHGVIALSERRGAFVSAVTHELRTPLTTFRMYAEMLAEGMTTSAQQRQHYVETLRVEADRLAHLVENVLSYAQLERGRRGRQREDVTLGELVDRARGRLADRAGQAEMQLIVDAGQQVRGQTVHTDPTAVEQILFNLVDNACKYAAVAEDRRIHLQLETTGREARLRVKDHGPGISAAQARRLFRPFSKSVHEAASTAPGVGLGLALCRRLACDLGGRLELEDTGNNGASFMLTLPRSC
jgi:signal transduction histidine kinase